MERRRRTRKKKRLGLCGVIASRAVLRPPPVIRAYQAATYRRGEMFARMVRGDNAAARAAG